MARVLAIAAAVRHWRCLRCEIAGTIEYHAGLEEAALANMERDHAARNSSCARRWSAFPLWLELMPSGPVRSAEQVYGIPPAGPGY
jgi:hypothetical protein